MPSIDDALNLSDLPRRQLEARIKQMFRDYSNNRPRSLQSQLGPSEIGSDCPRQLAYGLTAGQYGKGCNASGDPWRSYVGTAVHKENELVLQFANEQAGETIWIPEARVGNNTSHPGTCDAYDTLTQTVVDWKHPGNWAFDKYKKAGEPSLKYKVQANIYGKGYEALGFPVRHVGIMFIGAASNLHHGWLWMDDYRPELADKYLERLEHIKNMCAALDVEHKPEHFKLIPIMPSDECQMFCSYWSPDPQGPRQCPGKK